MQYVTKLPVPFKVYYNDKVYSPVYSSIGITEIVNKLIKDGGRDNLSVIDVGCGSGFIGLGIKLCNPRVDLSLCDISSEAIKVSKLNAKRLGVLAKFAVCDMLPAGHWDIICANMPTFSDEDMEQELHGPFVAYYAGEPLRLYRRLFEQAHGRTKALVCECQVKYQEPFLKMAQELGWELILSSEMSFAFTAKRAKN